MLLAGIKILVAEDEPELRDGYIEEFEYRGASVVGVADGNQAWLKLSNQPFDVLLSDVRMPGGNGVDLVKKIDAGMTAKPLIFLCTGYSDSNLDDVKKIGVIEVFSKPFDINHIVKVIAESVKIQSKFDPNKKVA